jgi:hypothetical protein
MALTLNTALVVAMLDTAAGKGFGEALNLGIIHLYGSPRPASSDDAETGTLLAIVSDASQAWTVADGTNGLTFATAADGAVTKTAAQVWSGVGLVAGTATWGRFYAYDGGGVIEGASTTRARFDFSVGTFSGDLIMGNASIAVAATTTVDSFSLALPNGE